ncbi:MAG: protein-L-isoaspartate O-methyltransferase [Chloroflexi bacterium RBG_16_68_14]|nr:MAG: protein-L-isoaspartate O-methyltransferase [Chloroflexi bacterium RBG_16_68_14]
MDYQAAREDLVRSLRAEIREERLLAAFAQVPRERFVPPELQRYAYDDRPLPIGHGQTISQPLMVAIMTQALELRGDEKVLEVGTGSGYQAALLSLLAREVVSVERIAELAEAAARRLQELGYANVRVFVAGTGLGWPQEAPYDAITVTAGAPDVPTSLVDQLAMGGRMVVPVGGRRLQQLVRVTRSERGVTMERLGECRFVPLIAPEEGWPEWEASDNGAAPWP